MAGGCVGMPGFFPQDFLFIFFRLKTRELFSQSESQNTFFQEKAKTKYFVSIQHICSKCIILDSYVRVFLEPNIHGYIVYMFVYILDIGSECICIY